MNIREMKLALTVDLMNLPVSQSPLIIAEKAMQRFKTEAGKFTGLFARAKSPVANGFEWQSFALQFERCTLDLELVTDPDNHNQYIQSFNLKAN